MWTTRLKPQGFALPSAIFILVILAALGAYAVKTSSSQHLALALDFQGARAFQAARAGADWGIYQAVNDSTGSPACGAACSTAACTRTFLPAPDASALPGDLGAYTVTVACTCTAYCEGARDATNPLRVYSLTAIATQGSGGSYVERRLSATVQN